MRNLTADYYPLLGTRAQRYLYRTVSSPNGFYCHDGVYWVSGTGFYANGVFKGTVTDTRKRFCSLGSKIIILPDNAYYDISTDTFGQLGASAVSIRVQIRDGEYMGEWAAANTIYAYLGSFTDIFRAGDAVFISGASSIDASAAYIIREVDGRELRFYENSFSLAEDDARNAAMDSDDSDTDTRVYHVAETATVTIERRIPDMDYICENENRLWGCKGDSIYASKLGDPTNWYCFDGLSTDSYSVDLGLGSAGDFTACCAYLGYPTFFKEEHIYKIYGDRPTNFQAMASATLGVEAGSDRSLAVAGEVLYYQSRIGIVAYSGGIPTTISRAFGTERHRNAVGGSDGRKYYCSMADAAGNYRLYVYDSQTRLWHIEDDLQVMDFGWLDELYFMDAGGSVWVGGNIREVPSGATEEAAFDSFVETGDFTLSSPDKKGTSKFQLRVELDAGATLTVRALFDSGAERDWITVGELTAQVKRSYYLPIVPRRADHLRLRLEGRGQWRLYSFSREDYSGSALRSTSGRN